LQARWACWVTRCAARQRAGACRHTPLSARCRPSRLLLTLGRQLTVWRLPEPRQIKALRQGQPAPADNENASGDGGALLPPPVPIAASRVPRHEQHVCVRFNPADTGELITNGARRALFWRLPAAAAAAAAVPGGGESAPPLSCYSPPLAAVRQPVGDFLASAFVPGSRQVRTRGWRPGHHAAAGGQPGRGCGRRHVPALEDHPQPFPRAQALTSTAGGDVVVWDEQGLSAPGGTRATDRHAAKVRTRGTAQGMGGTLHVDPAAAQPVGPTAARPPTHAAAPLASDCGVTAGGLHPAPCPQVVHLHEKAIPFLGTVGGFVVTGGADGLVRFFDGTLRLAAWFEDLRAGPVAAVTFSTAGDSSPAAASRLNR
jgi:hypothetical protein